MGPFRSFLEIFNEWLALVPPEVHAAHSALSPTGPADACGRPTKTTGSPCKQLRRDGMAACGHHATETERRMRTDHLERAQSIINGWTDSRTPECWRWTVTEDDRGAVAAATERNADGVMWRWQDGHCAACGAFDRSDLQLDHDHATGLIRGWLCLTCNYAEPGATDGALARYRERNPASMLGIQARYYHPFFGWAEPQTFTLALADDPSYLVAAAVAAARATRD